MGSSPVLSGIPTSSFPPSNSKMLRLIILALTIAFATAAPTWEEETKYVANGVNLRPIFETFDDNSDAVIQKVELAQLMLMADTEEPLDQVDAAEFEKYWKEIVPKRPKAHAKYFKLVDGLGKTDGAEDGIIDEAEREKLFEHIDKDNSGGISLDEFFAAISAV